MTEAGTDHLLRTLAAVAVGSRILDVDNEDLNRISQLRSLDFDVVTAESTPRTSSGLHANGQPTGSAPPIPSVGLAFDDASFDWIIADRSSKRADSLLHTLDVLIELRRVLKPGGWIYLVLPAGDVSSGASDDECLLAFYKIAAEANFELAEPGVVEAETDARFARAIFRRVESDTAV
jgi:SAM-dependent methyltransferase